MCHPLSTNNDNGSLVYHLYASSYVRMADFRAQLAAAAALATHFASLESTTPWRAASPCVLHGSNRTTEDFDLVVDIPANQVPPLKNMLADMDTRLSAVGNSLYFRHPASTSTVSIELLSVSNFSWPSPLNSGSQTVSTGQGDVRVLKPATLLISKLGRTASSIGSTRPRTLAKRNSDLYDIGHLIPLIPDGSFEKALQLYPVEKRDKIIANLTKVTQVSGNVRLWVEGMV